MPNNGIPVGVAHSQFFVRERQDWTVQQEKMRHEQALYQIGEPAMFIMLWKVEDHYKGYVRRCARCYSGPDESAAEAYNQSTKNRCPMCFGTTFEGGIRAKVIRPALFSDVDDQEQNSQRGVTYPERLTVESTGDFRFRPGDFVFRADGSRWQLSTPTRVQLRTGYGHPSQGFDAFAFAQGMASLEDNTSVAWIIPPNQDDLKTILQPDSRFPTAKVDLTNGPLIPDAWTD
jgi:hypothetical protein